MRIIREKLTIDYPGIDGIEMIKAREKLGFSQTEFAEKCNHTQQYQSQLEEVGFHRITEEKAEEIKNVFENN